MNMIIIDNNSLFIICSKLDIITDICMLFVNIFINKYIFYF